MHAALPMALPAPQRYLMTTTMISPQNEFSEDPYPKPPRRSNLAFTDRIDAFGEACRYTVIPVRLEIIYHQIPSEKVVREVWSSGLKANSQELTAADPLLRSSWAR